MQSIKVSEALESMHLSQRTLGHFVNCSRLGHFHPREILVNSWRPLEHCYYLARGLISPALEGPGGTATALSLNGRGTFLGSATVLNSKIPGTDWICLTEVFVVAIPVSDVIQAFETDAGFSRFIAQSLAIHNINHLEMYKVWRSAQSEYRVVLSLARMSVVLGLDDELVAMDDTSLAIPLTQSVLAAMCGVSRSVFSACVQKLSLAGWLKADYGALQLLQIASWRALATARHRMPPPHGSAIDMAAVIAWMNRFKPVS
ncbi:MAG: Crp/Fnr family transcriptional regulator [Burkholderiaceae bacterium]